MKFTPPLSAEQQLETQVNQLKQQFKRRQFPKKNAPALPLDLLVTISGAPLVCIAKKTVDSF